MIFELTEMEVKLTKMLLNEELDQIEELIKEGLLVREEDRIRLTDRGIDLSNYALSQFLLDE